jgi:uncharacterized protein
MRCVRARRCPTEPKTQIGPVFRRKLPFQAPFTAQTALRIDAKAVKFRRENSLSPWLVWLDVLSIVLFQSCRRIRIIENMTEALSKLFQSQSNILVAILFGSCAQSNQTFESDVDIAVLADGPIAAEFRIKLIEEIALVTGRSVDLIDLSLAGQPLLGQILKNAVRLKGTDSDMAKLYVRNVLEVADFLPYVTRTLKERQRAWTK